MSPSPAGRRRGSARKAEGGSARLLPVLIIAVGIGTYWNSLSGPFIWDDQTAIVTNSTVQHLWPMWTALNPPRETPVAGRPLVNLSFAVNYALGGVNETGYHAVNIAIHIACALLLFGIVRRTLVKKGYDPFSDDSVRRKGVVPLFRSAELVALVVALLWTVHPLVSEVVDYVTQRSESMMALFLLLTLYSAIRARAERGRGPRNHVVSTSGRRWQMLAILACMCGMATKESMIVAPVIVVLYDRTFEFDSFAAMMRARAPFYTGLALTWAIAGAILWSAPRSTVGVSATVGSWTYLLNQVGVLGRYLRLTMWPSGLVLDYGLPRPLTLGDALPGGIAIAGLVAVALVARARWPAIGFLAASFFMVLAPTSSVIPIRTEVGAERRMYLPLAALVTLAVIGVHALVERRRTRHVRPTPGATATVVTGFLVAALGATTIARNAEYQNPLALWRADVERRPHGRSRMALATELATAGQHAEAIEQLRLAVTDFPNARAALGTELLLQQQVDEGASVLQRFIADGPSLPNRIPAHVLLAQAFASKGQLDQAEAEWRAVLALSPADLGAKASLAQILSILAQSALRQDDAARGEAYAREAVQLAPHNAVAFNLLGVALASTGRIEEARSYFREALQIAPDDRQVRNNLERADRALATRSRPTP